MHFAISKREYIKHATVRGAFIFQNNTSTGLINPLHSRPQFENVYTIMSILQALNVCLKLVLMIVLITATA